MSARDVIALWLDDYVGSRDVVGLKSDADAILSALDKAGYAVVPKSLLAKLPSDPPMSGLPKVDLAKVYCAAAKETP